MQAAPLNPQPAAPRGGEIGVSVGTNGKSNGLLEIHHELVSLRLQEDDLKGLLRKVAEMKGALEQQLRSWPGQPKKAGRPKGHSPRLPVRAARAPKRKVAARAKRKVAKGGGAPAQVLSVLQANRGEPITVKDIKAQLPNVPAGSIYNALSNWKKRGKAKSAGAGKWASA